MVAEGEVTEPDYCTALNNRFKDEHRFHINTRYSRENGLHPLEVAEEAITIASDPRERRGSGPVHEVWALFDRDQHTDVRAAFAPHKGAQCGSAGERPQRRSDRLLSSVL